MVYQFGLDLKVARRRSALTQADCAHLLGVDQPRISKFEAGTAVPTVVELSILCLIFDRPIGGMSQEIVISVGPSLQERLASMPPCPETWHDRAHRLRTLGLIAQKLSSLDDEAYE
jgi:transcriptional regulator with XRE-family HTH domain